MFEAPSANSATYKNHLQDSFLMETQSKYSILPLFLISFMDMIGIGIIIPLFGPIFLDASISILPDSYSYTARTVLLGLLIAAYPFAQFFGAPLLGAWSDRHGRKKLLMIAGAFLD